MAVVNVEGKPETLGSNPNDECRNPKEIRKPKSETQKRREAIPPNRRGSGEAILTFVIRHSFGFRHSSFGFPPRISHSAGLPILENLLSAHGRKSSASYPNYCYPWSCD